MTHSFTEPHEPEPQLVDLATVTKALANPKRLQVLSWLKQPQQHFPPQVDGDLLQDGVCSGAIADKLGVSAPTLSEHMRCLSRAGLVRAKRMKGWVFYQRNDERIQAVVQWMGEVL